MGRFSRRNHGQSHSYMLDGFKVPGVTTILKVLDKSGPLTAWAARESAAYADDNWEMLSGMRSAERIALIEKARWNTNRKAITKGNRIHALGERLAKGETVEVPLEIRSQVEAYARFLDEWELEVLATETPVANTEARYAGTLDLVTRSPRLGVSLADIKTGKGVYDETALQLNAYAACDLRLVGGELVGPRGGVKTVWAEAPMIETETSFVAHVRDDRVEMRPVRRSQELVDVFLWLTEIHYEWIERTGWDYRDAATYDPPVLAAVNVEDEEVRA